VTLDVDVKPVIRSVVESMRMMRCIPHDFLWHTSDVDARAAQWPVLDDCRFSTVLRRTLCVCESTTAAADNQKVVTFRHSSFSLMCTDLVAGTK